MKQYTLITTITALIAIARQIGKAYGTISFFHDKATRGQGVKALLVIEESKPYQKLSYEKRLALPSSSAIDLHRTDIRVASITSNAIGIERLLDRLDQTFTAHFQEWKWERITPARHDIHLNNSVITESTSLRHKWGIAYWSEGPIPSQVIREALSNCFELEDLSQAYEQCQRRTKRHTTFWIAGAAISLLVGFVLKKLLLPAATPWAWFAAAWYLCGIFWIDLVMIHEMYSRARMAKV